MSHAINLDAPPPPRTIGPITRTDVVRYQGASGDFNPIHHDEPFATGSGYPAPLVVGMYTAGAMNAWASDWLGPQNLRETRIRWKRPVFPGDVLTASGEVLKTYEEGGETRVDLELKAAKEDGQVVVQGWMTFVVG